MKSLEKLHFRVSGNVQGVGFRYHTTAKARELGLRGWVKNLADGRVEGVAEGESEALDALLLWCRQGPDHARVESVEVIERGSIPAAQYDRFETVR